jgi:shikimate kinase
MGSGKTTLGTLLGGRLRRRFIDSDQQIIGLTGRTGRQIAETDGVEALHQLELEVFLAAMLDPEPAVVAAAASVIEDPRAREALAGSLCVWVTAAPGVLTRRTSEVDHRRRLRRSEALQHRLPLFEEAADLVIDTGATPAEDAVAIVMDAIAGKEG